MKNAALLLAILMVISFVSEAFAYTKQYYGSNGSYQGSAYSNGRTTQYFGSNGGYQGTSYLSGRTTQYYGSNGGYQGTSYGSAWNSGSLVNAVSNAYASNNRRRSRVRYF